MKIIFFLIMFFLVTVIFGGGFSVVRAETSDVQMSVNVVERKITDTINDFVFEGLLPPSPISNQEVKGIATKNSDIHFWDKAWNLFKWPFLKIKDLFNS